MKSTLFRILTATVLSMACSTAAFSFPYNFNFYQKEVGGSTSIVSLLDNDLPFVGTSFGTINVTGNIGNERRVDINVTLSNSDWKILAVWLNYEDDRVPNLFDLQASDPNFRLLTTTGETVMISENNLQAGANSTSVKFDLQDPDKGNLGEFGVYDDTFYTQTEQVVGEKNGKPIYGPFTDVFDLNADNFDFLDTTERFFAGMHIGNINNGDSMFVFATDEGTPPGGVVPEPGTLLLLGAGLAGLALYTRKRSR